MKDSNGFNPLCSWQSASGDFPNLTLRTFEAMWTMVSSWQSLCPSPLASGFPFWNREESIPGCLQCNQNPVGSHHSRPVSLAEDPKTITTFFRILSTIISTNLSVPNCSDLDWVSKGHVFTKSSVRCIWMIKLFPKPANKASSSLLGLLGDRSPLGRF